jgi:hypothetical protein
MKAKTATGGPWERKTQALTRTTVYMKWWAMGGECAGFNTNTKRQAGGTWKRKYTGIDTNNRRQVAAHERG